MSVPVDDAERAALHANYNRTGNARAEFKKFSGKKNHENQSLDDLWKLMRSAGILGRTGQMLQAAADGRARIAALSAKPETHDAHRRTMAFMMMDMGRPGFASDEMLRHLPKDLAASKIRGTATRLSRCRTQLSPLFYPINRFLEGEGSLQPLEKADLGLIAPLHVIAQSSNTLTDVPPTLLKMLATTYDLAKAAGLTVSLIPDFLFASMKSRPEHILSFRTAGQFPGFVHFKNADLPDYMCIDAGGYSGWSTISGRPLKSLDMPTLANSRKICDKLFKDQVPVDDAKLPQPDQDAAAMPLPARYVFVALQGKVVDGPDPERFGTKAMLQIVMDRFQGTDISVVVKLPPRLTNANLIGWLIAETQLGSIILSENSMHSLAAGSEAVITVNSKVGSEVMIHRKPIYCFGGSDYDAIAHRITSADQFKDLTTPIRPAVRENDLLRFIAYYRTKYLVNRAEPGRLESVLQERLIDPILKARTV